MNTTDQKNYTKRFIAIFGVILLLANIILGTLLVHQSSKMVQTLIRKNMLDISDTAAAFVNGERFADITEETVGMRDYNEIYRDLAVFRDHVDIEYIYAVRPMGNDRFIFIVDTDRDDPADYGEEIVLSEALLIAATGVSAVDTVTVADEWGNFYTSYSPIKDHTGHVVGIVGVDFSSDWFDNQVRRNTVLAVIFSAFFTLASVLLMFIIYKFYSRRMRGLNDELDSAQSQALTDDLTGLGNTRGYDNKRKEINKKIAAGTADFAIVFYDINYLKKINDKFGHSCGDQIIRAAADEISGSFDKYECYRIGGDEIVVIAEGITPEELKDCMNRVIAKTVIFDTTDVKARTNLSLSSGYSFFDRKKDKAFVDVFMRADANMYDNKRRYHEEAERQS